MADKIEMWKAKNGSLFQTEAEAEQEDFVVEISDVLEQASYSYDYNTDEGARALLKHFRVVRLEQNP